MFLYCLTQNLCSASVSFFAFLGYLYNEMELAMTRLGKLQYNGTNIRHVNAARWAILMKQ